MSKNPFADVISKLNHTVPGKKVDTPSMSNFSVIFGAIILVIFAIIFIFVL